MHAAEVQPCKSRAASKYTKVVTFHWVGSRKCQKLIATSLMSEERRCITIISASSSRVWRRVWLTANNAKYSTCLPARQVYGIFVSRLFNNVVSLLAYIASTASSGTRGLLLQDVSRSATFSRTESERVQRDGVMTHSKPAHDRSSWFWRPHQCDNTQTDRQTKRQRHTPISHWTSSHHVLKKCCRSEDLLKICLRTWWSGSAWIGWEGCSSMLIVLKDFWRPFRPAVSNVVETRWTYTMHWTAVHESYRGRVRTWCGRASLGSTFAHHQNAGYDSSHNLHSLKLRPGMRTGKNTLGQPVLRLSQNGL